MEVEVMIMNPEDEVEVLNRFEREYTILDVLGEGHSGKVFKC
jgi:hypothetical protein